jgi:hypothetical protein
MTASKKSHQIRWPFIVWLPIVDAYRTICIAPTPEARAVFEAVRELDVSSIVFNFT